MITSIIAGIINLTILECKFGGSANQEAAQGDNKSNHIGM